MKIVVTGGSGRLGSYLAKELSKNHEVTVFDKKETKSDSVKYYKGDVLNIDDCKKAFEGSDLVVHLAGIPDTWNDSPEVVFHVNTLGTFNVYQACSKMNIKKVVYAGSETSYGFHFRLRKNFLPEYLPLDEEHPLKPADAYGLSKKFGEEIGLSFMRRFDISTVVIRIVWIWFPEEVEIYRKLVKDPGISWMGFWSYVDYRDAVQAFKLAAETECRKKFEVFLIAANENGTEFDSMELVKKYYSEKIRFVANLKGNQALHDTTKAKCMLGYNPQYTWRDLIK
jgi:UDP-glucose 4-epimerase